MTYVLSMVRDFLPIYTGPFMGPVPNANVFFQNLME